MLENPWSMSAILDTAVRCARFAIDFSLGIRHGVTQVYNHRQSNDHLTRIRVIALCVRVSRTVTARYNIFPVTFRDSRSIPYYRNDYERNDCKAFSRTFSYVRPNFRRRPFSGCSFTWEGKREKKRYDAIDEDPAVFNAPRIRSSLSCHDEYSAKIDHISLTGKMA